MMSEPLTCRELVELVTGYLERALPALARARDESHLAHCPHCRTHLAQMQQTVEWLGQASGAAVSPLTRQRLLSAFRARQWGAV
jgi:anti-sigma factor RsiW